MSRLLLATVLLCVSAAPARAQFGLVEGLFRNVSDISFYIGRSGGGRSVADELDRGARGFSSFGLELLFPIHATTRPRETGPADSVSVRWTETRVVRSGGRSDTTHTYVVTPRAGAADTLWSYELAVGYGQLSGFELRDERLDMRVTVRELPAVTFYVSHEPSGVYGGVRSGLLQTFGLQVYDEADNTYVGSAQAFQFGLAAGYATQLGMMYPFIEGGYMHRALPTIEWQAPTLPPGVPRQLDLSGWQLQVGVQVPLHR